jgi:leucine-zipper of insertion element IS481
MGNRLYRTHRLHFPRFGGGSDAMEGAFGDGRKSSVCSSPASRDPMAELCREFGISRKTGYKIVDRYPECGVPGLTDRSRRPYR